jgi:hypothetical protein
VASRRSQLFVPIYTQSFDGKYWGRYPHGDKPNIINLAGSASDVASATAALQTQIKLAANASDIATATAQFPSGIIPQSGFSGTLATTATHGALLTVDRTSGSWGTHADKNPANHQFMGHRYLCALMASAEGGAYEIGGLSWAGGGALWDVVTSGTTAPPTNLTKSFRHRGVSSRQGELQWAPEANETDLIVNCLIKYTSGSYDGKFWRLWGSFDSEYVSSGGSSGTTLRGGNDAADDVFSSPNNFNSNAWNYFELYTRQIGTGRTFKPFLNRAKQWTKSWPTSNNNLNGHTLDLDNLLEVGNTIYFADYFLDFHTIAFFLTDSATFSSSTKRIIQPPSQWSTTEVELILNQGQLASIPGSYLHSFDYTTETSTYILAIQ